MGFAETRASVALQAEEEAAAGRQLRQVQAEQYAAKLAAARQKLAGMIGSVSFELGHPVLGEGNVLDSGIVSLIRLGVVADASGFRLSRTPPPNTFETRGRITPDGIYNNRKHGRLRVITDNPLPALSIGRFIGGEIVVLPTDDQPLRIVPSNTVMRTTAGRYVYPYESNNSIHELTTPTYSADDAALAASFDRVVLDRHLLPLEEYARPDHLIGLLNEASTSSLRD